MDKYYCWACDFSNRTGEGNLARLFIKKSYLQNYQIFTTSNIKFLKYKYLSPLIGILFCWYLFIKRKKVVYLNYLPLWNCFLFMFLPPGTILGPITGGANIGNKQIVIRKYIFPVLYKVSEIFILCRKTNICFSTDLLKKYLSKKTLSIAKFNFVLNYLKKIKKKKKKKKILIS